MSQMTRFSFSQSYALDAEADALPISMEGMAGGSVESTQAQTILVYGSNKDTPGGNTFVAAKDEDGVAVTMTLAAAGIHALPSACYSYRYIKLVDAGHGTVYLHIKS